MNMGEVPVKTRSQTQSRRSFLKLGAGFVGAGMLQSQSISAATGLSCQPTAPQTEGPFYPGEKKFSNIQDLTWVPGSQTRALGQVVYITGKVVDTHCRPIGNANVEIWQACESGKYNNPKDPNPAKIDPNFLYWAETYTDETGFYSFKTVIPGSYPAAADWTRPPHIHFKISALGYRELTTQMYFSGHPLNDQDAILKQLRPSEQKNVLVDFKPSSHDLEPGSLAGNFEITLRPVRS